MTETRVNVEHYNTGTIETIDYIADVLGPVAFRAYVLGNIIKYASRALYKGQYDSDIEKIRNYTVILQEQEQKTVTDTVGAIKSMIAQINEAGELIGHEDWEKKPRVKPGDLVYVLPNPRLHESEEPWVDPDVEGKYGIVTEGAYNGAPEVRFDDYHQYISERYLARAWENTDDIVDGVNKVYDMDGDPMWRVGSTKAFAYYEMGVFNPDDNYSHLIGRTGAAPYREAL